MQARAENAALGFEYLVFVEQICVRGKPVAKPVTGRGRQAYHVAQRGDHKRNIGTDNFEMMEAMVDHHDGDTQHHQ